jgi:hypothetical protein
MPRELINQYLLGKRIFDPEHQWPSRESLTAPIFDSMKNWLTNTKNKHLEDFRNALIVSLDNLNEKQLAGLKLVDVFIFPQYRH